MRIPCHAQAAGILRVVVNRFCTGEVGMRPYIYSVLLSAYMGVPLFAQPVEPRSFPAQKLSRPPVIDGVVNPDEWAEAYFVERFWSPSRQQWGAFPTRAYIGYDSEAVYVAFICEDPDPSQIRAQETKRGGYLENDDTVLVLLEPQRAGWSRTVSR
jgi:hypothetical protein